MTQPDYVPLVPADRVRTAERLPPAVGWMPTRPGDDPALRRPTGLGAGRPAPDLGYGLKLARHFEDRLELTEGEDPEDAVAGCFVVGATRASLFHRAPVIHDMELAFTLWGFLGGAPADLIAARKPLFVGAAHHYWDRRAIVDAVREETLRLTPAQVRERLSAWKSLLCI